MNRMKGWGELVAILVTVVVSLLALALMVWAAVQAEKRWAKFAAEHDCKVVGKMKGDLLVSITIDSKGQMGIAATAAPDKTGYLCNDGVTYWR